MRVLALSSCAFLLAVAEPECVPAPTGDTPSKRSTKEQLEPEACLERILARGGTRDRFEELERLRMVREAYDAVLGLCRTRGERLVRVDASGTRDAIFAQLLEHVRPLLAD